MYSPIPHEVLETTIKVYRFYIEVNRKAAQRSQGLQEAARYMADATDALVNLTLIENAANFHRGVFRVANGTPLEPQA